MELEITWGRVTRIWWSYVWRNLIAVIAAMVLGGILGAVLGFVMGKMGVPRQAILFITAPIGFIIGLLVSIVPMKLILGKDFGEFRLVLLSNDSAAQ